jgi:hypothetical protein
MKTIYYWTQKPKENKAKELQIYTSLYLKPEIYFNLNLSQQDTNIFNFDIELFGLLNFLICKDKKSDHAGLRIELNIFGLNINYIHYDIRHWDDENDTWCKYD